MFYKPHSLQLQIKPEQMGTTMQIIANQKKKLRKHIALMENRQQEYINTKLEERDQNLLNVLKEIQVAEKQIAATKQKKWWIFRK